MKRIVWMSVFVSSLAPAILAQTVYGTVTGIISDPSDSVIAQADVSARSRSTGLTTQVESTAAGVYSVSLPPGAYDLTVEAPGFKTLIHRGVEVNVNQTSRIDLRLELGQVTESVTVETSAVLVQADSSERGMLVSEKEVLDLPLSTPGQRRMADSFTLLIPGVTTGGGAGGSFAAGAWNMGGQWQVNGSQEDSKEILYDGVSMGKIHSVGRFWAESPPPDSLQEFKMLTGSYSAEFGRSAGGVINLSTKSGSNQVHGSLYEFLRNEKLHARGFFAPDKAKDRQNEFGGTFGGPVYIPKVYDGRNKTFFFFFYNGMRWRTANANELVTVPPPEFLRGDFSNFVGADGRQRPIYDPATNRPHPQNPGVVVRDQFPGNVIPQSRISRVSANIAALLPAPMFDRQTLNFVGVRETLSNDDRFQIKLDHSLTDKHRLSGLYNRGHFVRSGNGPLPQEYFSGFTTRDEIATVVRLKYDFIVSPTVLNHFAAGYNRDPEETATPSRGEGWPARLGLTGVHDINGAFPRINFGDADDFGEPLSGEANAYQTENSFVFSDTLSIVRGKHSLRVGGGYRRYQYNARKFGRAHGTFNFSPAMTELPNLPTSPNTGSSIASFLLGAVSSGTAAFPSATNGFRYKYYHAFIQDDFKITRTLTLNLGLRYEVATPVVDVNDNLSVFDMATPNPAAGGLPGAIIFAGSGPGRSGHRTFADTDYSNFGPRIGLAYQFMDKTVLRMGYGIFYGVGGASAENGNAANLAEGFNAEPTFVPIQNAEPAFYWDNGFPQNFPHPPLIDPAVANGQSIANWIRSEDGRPPYVQDWHVGVQRELPGQLLLDVAYVGSKGTRLSSRSENINQLHPSYLSLGDLLNANITSQAAINAGISAPFPGFRGTVAQALRPFPQYMNITGAAETLGMSTYNSLQVLAKKRYSHGLHLSGAYTFSKKLSDGAERNNVNNPTRMDHYNAALEKSLSRNDMPHVVAIGYSYELPFGRGRTFLNSLGPVTDKIIGGWQIAGMSRYQSGVPLRVTGGLNTGIFSGNRPTYVPGESIRTDVSAGDFDPATDRWLNRSAFSNGQRFAFGDVPRQIHERGFPFYDESFSILKNFAIREAMNLQFRAEFYNFLNRVNFALPNTNVNANTFGSVSSQLGNPRQMQMGLRLNF